MKPEDEIALKVTKEIVIKFIEVGRLSMNSFDEVFKQVYSTVLDSLKDKEPPVKPEAKVKGAHTSPS